MKLPCGSPDESEPMRPLLKKRNFIRSGKKKKHSIKLSFVFIRLSEEDRSSMRSTDESFLQHLTLRGTVQISDSSIFFDPDKELMFSRLWMSISLKFSLVLGTRALTKWKIKQLKMPDEVRKKALAELRKLETGGSQSHERPFIRNYLEISCSIFLGLPKRKRVSILFRHEVFLRAIITGLIKSRSGSSSILPWWN